MKLGIIGYGNIGKKHHSAIQNLDTITLEALCDQLSIEDTNLRTYSSIDAFFQNEKDLDFVSICTPNAFHKTQCIQALNAGLNVICEKPFALNTQDCQEVIDAAKRNNKQLFCVMQNRFSNVMQWLKKTVDEQRLGKIYLINLCCYWNRNKDYYRNSQWRGDSQLDGGTLFTQFSHYVDMLYWAFGMISIDHAMFGNFNHDDMISFEDTGTFNFSLEKGGFGNFSYTTSTFEKNFESTLSIISEKGTLKIGGQYMNELIHCNIKDLEIPDIQKSDNLTHLKKLYQNTIANINDGTAVMTTPDDGKNVVEIIEKVYAYKK